LRAGGEFRRGAEDARGGADLVGGERGERVRSGGRDLSAIKKGMKEYGSMLRMTAPWYRTGERGFAI
jgi:hypothetical protein